MTHDRRFVIALLGFLTLPAHSLEKPFEIRKILVHEDGSKLEAGIQEEVIKDKKKVKVFVPQVQVIVRTLEDFPKDGMMAKLYLFGERGEPLGVQESPGKPVRKGDHYAMPSMFKKKEDVSLFFAIPADLGKQKWTALAVFGDKYELTAKAAGSAKVEDLEFAERTLALKEPDPLNPVQRTKIFDPIVEQVVETDNTKQPRITLFLYLPPSALAGGKIEGVLARCVLAKGVEDIRNRLRSYKNGQSADAYISFAAKHNLAVVMWGSRQLWNPALSYDQLTKEALQISGRDFDDVAAAWDKGVTKFCRDYQLPEKHFLLYGESGAAQWAHRLALRQPARFLAVHVHINSSYDEPTEAAKSVLWLISTGDKEHGFPAAQRFFARCRGLGYPIMFKAERNLGHSGSPAITELGLRFFDYALAVRARMPEEQKPFSPTVSSSGDMRPSEFKNPPFVGDLINQEVLTGNLIEFVPEAQRVPIPTRAVAEAWGPFAR
jgi:hypothetical protein